MFDLLFKQKKVSTFIQANMLKEICQVYLFDLGSNVERITLIRVADIKRKPIRQMLIFPI